MWSSPCGSGARVRQRSVAGSYSSWWVPATPSTFPPITWIFPPTAARATSLRASGIGAFITQLPCACALAVAVNDPSTAQIVTNGRTFKNLSCMVFPFCLQLLSIQPCGGDSTPGEIRNFTKRNDPYQRRTLRHPVFAKNLGLTLVHHAICRTGLLMTRKHRHSAASITMLFYQSTKKQAGQNQARFSPIK